MKDNSKSGLAAKGEGFFKLGWLMVLITFFTAIVTQGFGLYGYSILRVSMTESLGVSATLVSTAFSVYALTSGFGGVVTGPFIERFGLRWALIVGAVLFGGGYLILAIMTEVWMMFVAYFIMGVGTAFSGPVVIAGIGSNWFIKRRGIATAAIWTGNLPGSLICSGLIAKVAANSSWQTAALVLAALSFGILFIASFFLKWRPQEVGLLPDGMTQVEADEIAKSDGSVKLVGLTRSQALKTATFWLLVVGILLVGIGEMGTFQNVTPFLVSNGYDVAFAASFMTFLSFAGVIGKLTSGVIIDKFGPKAAFVVLNVMCGVGLMTLALGYDNIATLYVGGFLFGVALSSAMICFSTATARFLGVEHYGRIWGVLFMFKPISDSVGVPLITAIGASAIGWTGAFGVAVVAVLVSAGFMLLAKKTPKLIEMEKEVEAKAQAMNKC